MPYIGAHMSIAGGLPRAIDRAVAAGCTSLQIFTKSAGQWRARHLPPDEIRLFRQKAKAARLAAIVAHDSYLINVAAAEPPLRARSISALAEELDRAQNLGLTALVMHPGAYTQGTERDGVRLVADALAGLIAGGRGGRTRILLEHTAGQGTSIGHRFEHLAEIIARAGGSSRLGVCLDTCHLVAAGYDITSERGYADTFRQFGSIVGFRRLQAFHLNDSKRPCGSRVDRHEHIGKGCLGLPTFRRLLNDRRFARMPMMIETPKEESRERGRTEVDTLDEMNLATLRSLLRSPQPSLSPNTSASNL
jgi:deoxyribonuclease-4